MNGPRLVCGDRSWRLAARTKVRMGGVHENEAALKRPKALAAGAARVGRIGDRNPPDTTSEAT